MVECRHSDIAENRTQSILRAAKALIPDAVSRRDPARTRNIAMKISARNVLEGKVVKVTKGATTAHVVLEVAGGAKVTASITNEAVDDLGLKVGDAAKAVVKASDVLVAID